MDILTEWDSLKKLLQNFSGQKVEDDELRWAPDKYQDSLNPEFLQLGRVAATLGTNTKVIGKIDVCWILFGKRVARGECEVPTNRPKLEQRRWGITPVEKQGSCFWLVEQLGKRPLSSAQLAERIKSELIRYHKEFGEYLKTLQLH
jgi:hypothetical protein